MDNTTVATPPSLAFIPSESSDVRLIKLSDIYPDPLRKPGQYDDRELSVIARGFLRHGVGFPVTVAHLPESPDKFLLVSGEKIFRSAVIAGLERLPCVIADDFPQSDEIKEEDAKPASDFSRSAFTDTSSSAKSKFAIKDPRFFFNSVRHAVSLMNEGGVPVTCRASDNGESTVLVITVPKSPPI